MSNSAIEENDWDTGKKDFGWCAWWCDGVRVGEFENFKVGMDMVWNQERIL